MTSVDPAATPRRTRTLLREELILDAAAQMIAERGLAHVRVSDVAERAGMSTGHVTYYFPSKSEMLMRAMGASEEQLVAEVERAILRVKDPWRRLDRLVSMSASSGPADQGWVLWFQVWHEASLDPGVAAVQEALDLRWRGILVDVLRYGASLGAFVVPHPETMARVLSAVVDGLSIQVTLGAEGLRRNDMLALFRKTARSLLAPADSIAPSDMGARQCN